MQAERMGLPVAGKRKRLHRAEIAYAAAAVFVRVAVEPLAPAAGAWHADPVVVARHRREVADDERAVCDFTPVPPDNYRIGVRSEEHPTELQSHLTLVAR